MESLLEVIWLGRQTLTFLIQIWFCICGGWHCDFHVWISHWGTCRLISSLYIIRRLAEMNSLFKKKISTVYLLLWYRNDYGDIVLWTKHQVTIYNTEKDFQVCSKFKRKEKKIFLKMFLDRDVVTIYINTIYSWLETFNLKERLQ